MTDTPTDEQVLADPGSFTVEQVTQAFARTGDSGVVEAKQLEADGEGRKGIVDWQRPQPRTQEPRFSRERLLGEDGPVISGHPRHVIVGALHDDDGREFTRAQIAEKVEAFLGRPVETPTADEDEEA